MSVLSRRLRETRRRLGLKQSELADALGVTQGTISRWETGGHEPDLSAMLKVAEMAGYDPQQFALKDEDHPFRKEIWGLNVEVVGQIVEDLWVEDPEWDESQKFVVQIPTLPAWEKYSVEGFVINDDSADSYYPKQSIVFIAKFRPGLFSLRHNDYVVVERMDDRGLYEVTIREIYVNNRNEIYLSSLSDDPSVGRSFKIKNEFDTTAGSGGESIIKLEPSAIRGVVVGSFRIENPKRFIEPEADIR